MAVFDWVNMMTPNPTSYGTTGLFGGFPWSYGETQPGLTPTFGVYGPENLTDAALYNRAMASPLMAPPFPGPGTAPSATPTAQDWNYAPVPIPRPRPPGEVADTPGMPFEAVSGDIPPGGMMVPAPGGFTQQFEPVLTREELYERAPQAAQAAPPPPSAEAGGGGAAAAPGQPAARGGFGRVMDWIRDNPSTMMEIGKSIATPWWQGGGFSQGDYTKSMEVDFQRTKRNARMKATQEALKRLAAGEKLTSEDLNYMIANQEAGEGILNEYYTRKLFPPTDKARPMTDLEKRNGGLDPRQNYWIDKDGEPFLPGAGGQFAPEDFGDVMQMSSQIKQMPAYKNYEQALPLYEALKAAVPVDSKAADIDIIFAIAKLFDPDSVVRGQEYQSIQQSQNIPDWLKSLTAEVGRGSRLSPSTRMELLQQGHSRMQVYARALDGALDQYRGMSQRYGINPGDIMPSNARKPEDFPRPEGTSMPIDQIQPGDVIRFPMGVFRYDLDPRTNPRAKPEFEMGTDDNFVRVPDNTPLTPPRGQVTRPRSL